LFDLSAGKVHGSLARAGKVRGNAPKVEKQDKKKLPKGRAFKRLQYNRRFVNVGTLLVGCPLLSLRSLRRACLPSDNSRLVVALVLLTQLQTPSTLARLTIS
jgi:small subunit ribosomal protein S30e